LISEGVGVVASRPAMFVGSPRRGAGGAVAGSQA
jgi:hypothetical protein